MLKRNRYTREEIIKAYKLLFSSNPAYSFENIDSLKLSALKAAYRKQALQNHPDRSEILGKNKYLLTKRFNEVNIAYKKLNFYLESKTTISIKTEKPKRHKQYNNNKKNERKAEYTKRKKENKNNDEQPNTKNTNRKTQYWKFPQKEVLFGQYLFYSGIISLQTLLNAIHWQRKQRPLYGRIAVEWNILTSSDIINIFKEREPFEKFGNCALRLGYINNFQHSAILCKQQNIQNKIGEYFIKNNIIDFAELNNILLEHKMHNQRIKQKK